MKKKPRKKDNRFLRVKGGKGHSRPLRVVPGLELDTGSSVTEATVAELARLVALARRATSG
jgi:hypothetical protein